MTDTLELAKQCGAYENVGYVANGEVLFRQDKLKAFRDACVREATEELQARVAMQDEALKDIACLTQSTDLLWWQKEARKAISATSEDVAAWQEKQLAPLRSEVAMLREVAEFLYESFVDCVEGGSADEVMEMTKAAINDTQTTAAAYEKEVAANVHAKYSVAGWIRQGVTFISLPEFVAEGDEPVYIRRTEAQNISWGKCQRHYEFGEQK